MMVNNTVIQAIAYIGLSSYSYFGNNVEFDYDIRGAVSLLRNSAFSQRITRNANGTVSSIFENDFLDYRVKHTYGYDNVGRLISDICDNDGSQGRIFSSTYTYDRNSNITSLTRLGYPGVQSGISGLVDDLTMTYDGNRLVRVYDDADEVLYEKSFDFQDKADNDNEYAYDSNGNLVADQNRGVSEVKYNEIGLPCRISFNNNRKIENRYSADGVKLSSDLILVGRELDDDIIIKSLIPGESTETSAAGDDAVVIPVKEKIRLKVVIDSKTYLGDYEFSGDSLIRFNTPYGYFLGGNFYANVYDYQGNLAVSGGEYFCGVAQGNSYYPYGLPVRGGGTTKFTSYLYGGKEFENRQGLNIYDFKARTYAPDECRFWQPDPKADDYHWLSPYSYCAGDPINFVDPDGKLALPLMTAIIGATIDLTTQISINLIEGQSFVDALCNVDVTSVVASGLTSMLLVPGVGSSAKITAGAINAADAAVDIRLNGDIKYVSGEVENEKPIVEGIMDFGVSILSDFVIKHSPINTSASVNSFSDETVQGLTKEEIDRATRIIFKVNGQGAKEGIKIAIDKQKNIEQSDAIRPLPPPVLNHK